MKIVVTESWVEAPLIRYVNDARARLALLLHPSGQVVAQAGFTRAIDVMTVCALASAVHATSAELGRQLDGKPFRGLHHAGPERQMYLASVDTARGSYICLTVFDAESSLGLIRVYFAELGAALVVAAPALTPIREPALAADFERDLNANLAAMFGRS